MDKDRDEHRPVRVERDLHRVLAEFEAAGAEEAMLVVMRPRGESILDLARHVL